MRVLTKEQRDFFHKNGYLHLKSFFTQEEVVSFRKGCQLDKPGDSMCTQEFRHIMFSPKIIGVMKDILGEEIIYPGLSLTRTGDSPKKVGSRKFHADTEGDDLEFSHPYPVINTGIYLQDHKNYSGCLKISPGSHKWPCVLTESITQSLKLIIKSLLRGEFKKAYNILNLHKSVNIPSEAGDLIIWYVRTHHSGYGVRLKFFKNISLPPVIENWIPSFLRLPDNPKRDVMLSIFTAPSKYLEEYIRVQINKDRRINHYLHNKCLDSPKIQKMAEEAGIVIRNDGYYRALKINSKS